MTILLSKKQSVSASQKQEEDAAKFSSLLSEKSQGLMRKFDEFKRKISTSMREMQSEHESFKVSIRQEKESLSNEVALIRLERTELLKPVDEIIETWKARLNEADDMKSEAERIHAEAEQARDFLIDAAEKLVDREKILGDKERKAETLILHLQRQIESLGYRFAEVTSREEKVAERESASAVTHAAIDEREKAIERVVRSKTDSLNERDKNLRLREIGLADREQRLKSHELRPK